MSEITSDVAANMWRFKAGRQISKASENLPDQSYGKVHYWIHRTRMFIASASLEVHWILCAGGCIKRSAGGTLDMCFRKRKLMACRKLALLMQRETHPPPSPSPARPHIEKSRKMKPHPI